VIEKEPQLSLKILSASLYERIT